MWRVTTILILVALLAGCQTTRRSGTASLLTPVEVVELKPAEAAYIATDLSRMLEQHFAPGQTTFALRKPPAAVLGPVLEKRLRDAGYGVSLDPTKTASNAVPMAYLVDRFDQSYIVRVQAGQGYELSRLYHLESGAFQAANGFSLRNEEKLQ